MPTEEPEMALRSSGYLSVAGVDEAGRGALAGPVVAAAVILPKECDITGIRDSKIIPEREREELFEEILLHADAWGVGIIDNKEIDRINILQSTFVAMRTAIAELPTRPDIALIDGRDAPDVGLPARSLIKGDSLSISIAAASILAKVTRDRMMRSEDERFPGYDFIRNKGYGTRAHREAILNIGPCNLHRLTFLGNLLQKRLPL